MARPARSSSIFWAVALSSFQIAAARSTVKGLMGSCATSPASFFRKRGFFRMAKRLSESGAPCGKPVSADPQGGHKGNWNNDEPYRTSYHVMRKKRPFRVSRKIDFGSRVLLGGFFRVPAPFLGCLRNVAFLGRNIRICPLRRLLSQKRLARLRPGNVPPHAAKFPHVPFPFDAIIVFLVDKAAFFSALFFPGPFLEYAADRRSLCRATEQGVYRVCKNGFPLWPSLGVLYAYPAHAAEPLEDASEALENLDDLVKSVDSVGHSFWAHRAAAAIRLPLEWRGNRPGFPIRRVCQGNSRSQDDRRDDDRDDD